MARDRPYWSRFQQNFRLSLYLCFFIPITLFIAHFNMLRLLGDILERLLPCNLTMNEYQQGRKVEWPTIPSLALAFRHVLEETCFICFLFFSKCGVFSVSKFHSSEWKERVSLFQAVCFLLLAAQATYVHIYLLAVSASPHRIKAGLKHSPVQVPRAVR